MEGPSPPRPVILASTFPRQQQCSEEDLASSEGIQEGPACPSPPEMPIPSRDTLLTRAGPAPLIGTTGQLGAHSSFFGDGLEP